MRKVRTGEMQGEKERKLGEEEEESRGRGESLGVNRFGETTIQDSHNSKLEPSPDVRREISIN
jgi:hypothetical protein